MTALNKMELRLPGSSWGLSARRQWEFGEYGQALDLRIAPDTTPAQAIDLVNCSEGAWLLTGLTLADLEAGAGPQGLSPAVAALPAVRTLLAAVAAYLGRLRHARAPRTQGEAFAPIATQGPLRARGLASRLQARLASAKGALPPAQWLATIGNYTRSGITQDEIDHSGVIEFLNRCDETSRLTGSRLAQACTFPALQLSILAQSGTAMRQLRLVDAPRRSYRRVQGEHRLRQPGLRSTEFIDPSLGYRVDSIEHQALWGTDYVWQAVNSEGVPLPGQGSAHPSHSRQAAEEAALRDAALRYPKHIASPRWQRWCWGGGESYREWLVTAPGLAVGYFSPHFELRNVLLHLRVDVRSNAQGEPVLLVQEVQSDWAQGAASRHPFSEHAAASPMPLAREWTLLAAKLLLLHAASLGVEHLAWTTGEQQAQRWTGLGEQHLRRLYDESLPQVFERLLGRVPGSTTLYIPVDFTTRVVEGGYEVLSRDGTVLGCAPSLDEVWKYVPSGAREDLVTVHAVTLPEAVRRAILANGFPAWGLPER